MKQLRKSEIKKLFAAVNKDLGIDLSMLGINVKSDISVTDHDGRSIVLANNEPILFYQGHKLVPTLNILAKTQFLKSVTIDMGAVKFIAKGADLMRPGITKIDDAIEPEELVAIVDEHHSKVIAVGLSMFSSEEIKKMDSGKVIKTVHYVGDSIWSFRC